MPKLNIIIKLKVDVNWEDMPWFLNESQEHPYTFLEELICNELANASKKDISIKVKQKDMV